MMPCPDFARRVCVTAFALAVPFAAFPARAEDPAVTPAPALPPPAKPGHLDPRRYELAGFPIVGGNSDIGFQFGAAATWTRFYDADRPYLWNIDLLLSASLKDDVSGLRLVQ